MCQCGPNMKLSREQCPRRASPLSTPPPAGHTPPGAVDRSPGCPAEPARLVRPPGLCPCAPGPALLPAGMESWAKLGGPEVCPGASGSLALRATAGTALPASVSCAQVSWWAGRPPESLFLGRNTPAMPEAAGAAGRPWSSCCSPLCWATGGTRRRFLGPTHRHPQFQQPLTRYTGSSHLSAGVAEPGRDLGPRSWPWAGLTPSFLRTLGFPVAVLS